MAARTTSRRGNPMRRGNAHPRGARGTASRRTGERSHRTRATKKRNSMPSNACWHDTRGGIGSSSCATAKPRLPCSTRPGGADASATTARRRGGRAAFWWKRSPGTGSASQAKRRRGPNAAAYASSGSKHTAAASPRTPTRMPSRNRVSRPTSTTTPWMHRTSPCRGGASTQRRPRPDVACGKQGGTDTAAFWRTAHCAASSSRA